MKIKLKMVEWNTLLNLMNDAAGGTALTDEGLQNHLRELVEKISRQFGIKSTEKMMRQDQRAQWLADSVGEDK